MEMAWRSQRKAVPGCVSSPPRGQERKEEGLGSHDISQEVVDGTCWAAWGGGAKGWEGPGGRATGS